MPLAARLPLLLIGSRLPLGGALLALATCQPPRWGAWAIAGLVAGVLTDVLDGVVARRLGVSTQGLRRLDSAVDQVFWAAAVGAAYLGCPGFFRAYAAPLLALLGAEALCYLVSFVRFRREVATHTFGAKAWVLVSLAALGQLYVSCAAGWLFWISIGLGLLSRLEILGILLVLRHWATDVPTLYHAWQLRRGRPIRRHRLFHG